MYKFKDYLFLSRIGKSIRVGFINFLLWILVCLYVKAFFLICKILWFYDFIFNYV